MTGVGSGIVVGSAIGVGSGVIGVAAAMGVDGIPMVLVSGVGTPVEGTPRLFSIVGAVVSTTGADGASPIVEGDSVAGGIEEVGFVVGSVGAGGVLDIGVEPTGAELVGWVVVSSGI